MHQAFAQAPVPRIILDMWSFYHVFTTFTKYFTVIHTKWRG